MKKRHGVILWFLLATLCAGAQDASARRDGSSVDKAIVIDESTSRKARNKEFLFIVSNYSNPHLLVDECKLISTDRWYDVAVFRATDGKHKIFFDVTTAHKKSYVTVEGHVLVANKFPTYPATARPHRWQGNGLFLLQMAADGNVKGVKVLESTRHRVFDNAAIDALRAWRFRAEKKPFSAKVPITFTLSGK